MGRRARAPSGSCVRGAARPAAGQGGGGTGQRVLAQPPAVADRAGHASGSMASAATTPSRKVRAGQRVEVELRAHSREPGLPARSHGARRRARGRAPAGDRQACRAGGPPGRGQLVGHAAQRAAGPPRRRSEAAACGHRAPARQGHLGPDGGGQDLAGDDRAGARHRRARGASAVPRDRARRNGSRGRVASTRRSAATRSRACAWRWWVMAGRPRTDVHRARASTPGIQRAARAPCTPGARTRSAFTWHHEGIRWLPMPCTAARRRLGSCARPCMLSGWRLPTRSTASRCDSTRRHRPTSRRRCQRLDASGDSSKPPSHAGWVQCSANLIAPTCRPATPLPVPRSGRRRPVRSRVRRGCTPRVRTRDSVLHFQPRLPSPHRIARVPCVGIAAGPKRSPAPWSAGAHRPRIETRSMNTPDAKRVLETALICASQPLPLRDMRALFADEIGPDTLRSLLDELAARLGRPRRRTGVAGQRLALPEPARDARVPRPAATPRSRRSIRVP